jgi:cobalamin synthase
LTGAVTRVAALAAAVLAVGVAGAVLRDDAIAPAAAVLVASLVLAGVYRRWLGGATGDALGAATQVGETVALLAAVAVLT